MAFEECIEEIIEVITEETTEGSIPTEETRNQIFWIIVSIIVITVMLIAVIVGVMYVLKQRKDKPMTTFQSAITQSTEKSYPVYPKGSITEDIERYHNRFIQSNTDSTATTKKSVKIGAKPKINKGIRSVVSPPKKLSVSPPKKTFSQSSEEVI